MRESREFYIEAGENDSYIIVSKKIKSGKIDKYKVDLRNFYTAEGGNTAWSERPAVVEYSAKSPAGDFSPSQGDTFTPKGVEEGVL